MRSFIEDYLLNPAMAISSASAAVTSPRFDEIDDEIIYKELASPEFRLYEEIIFSSVAEDAPRANTFATVA